MSDYKELVSALRGRANKCNESCLCYTHLELTKNGTVCCVSCECKRILLDAANAIEQLVKERDASVDAVPVRHGHWTDEHKCSLCGGEVFSEAVNIRPEYDYDWEENLVMTGDYEYDVEYHETDWCPFCGAKMDEVSE